MLSHRLDFAHSVIGPIARVMAHTTQIWPTRVDADGVEHVSDTEDWVGCIAEFGNGVTGVFESVKTATGYAGGPTSRDWCEVNASDGAVVYELGHPLRVLRAAKGGHYQEEAVPLEFQKIAGSPRNPADNPWQAFRYDQNFEFIEAIHQQARVRAVLHRRPAGAGSDGGDRRLVARAALGAHRSESPSVGARIGTHTNTWISRFWGFSFGNVQPF